MPCADDAIREINWQDKPAVFLDEMGKSLGSDAEQSFKAVLFAKKWNGLAGEK